MSKQELEIYIQQKLADLDKQKDMQEVINSSKLSFGMDSTTYGHLPAWNELLKQKKQLKRMYWTGAFFVSLMAVVIGGDFFEGLPANWLKNLVRLILISGVVMIFSTIIHHFSLFVKFRQTEREVRKLIYQDILFQLKKEEKEPV